MEPEDNQPNARKIEAAVSERTKAVVAVHLFGQACDMEPIMTLADVYHLYVVEDNQPNARQRFSPADH